MDLQYALLLIGIVIIAAIGISGYDKSRLNRRQFERRTLDREPVSVDTQETAATEVTVSDERPLDINPGPPTDLIKRSLKSDGFVAESSFIQDSELQQEFESAERVASVPVSVGPLAAATLASFSGIETGGLEYLFPPGQKHGPNPKIDFIVHLPGRGPLFRDRALGIYKQNEYVLEKPRQLYGLRYLAGEWFPLERDAEDSQYSDLALAIQMVDERGPIEESELETFLQVALKLADALKRRTRLVMTVERALTTARELQEFAQKYDVLASVNVAANNADFTGPAIKQAAEHFGMHFGAMNIFHMKNNNADGCRHLFSMANLYQPGSFDLDSLDSFETRGLTLFMTIPCVQDPARVFRKMVETAQGLSEMLGGRMIDQDQRPLSEEDLAAIQRQIGQITSDISAHGIVPGSETALRFFNP
ncbi:MAG: cell division protein ZipA [Acidiferrobacterales bacterium]